MLASFELLTRSGVFILAHMFFVIAALALVSSQPGGGVSDGAAAIDIDRGARDEVRRGVGEEERRVRDVRWV